MIRIALIVFAAFAVHLVYGQSELQPRSRYIVSMEASYFWYYRKPYADAGIVEEKKFAYSLSPKILFIRHKNFNYGLQYKYQKFQDLKNDTLISPPVKALGVITQYNIFMNPKKRILITCDGAFFMNNYSLLSKDKQFSLRSKSLKYPEIRLNTIVSLRLLPQLYAGIGIAKSYYPATNQLFLIRPSESYLLVSYLIQ